MKRLNTNTFAAVTDIFISLMLTVFLFCFGKRGYYSIAAVKLTAFQIICGGYVLLTVLLCAAYLRAHGGIALLLRRLKSLSAVQRLVIAYMLLTVLSAVLSENRQYTLMGYSRNEGALTLCIYCLCFLCVSVFGRPGKRLMYLLGASVLVFSAICILQLYGLDVLKLYPDGSGFYELKNAHRGEFLGTIGNTDLVAAFLCVSTPLLFGGLVRLKEKRRFVLLLPLTAAVFLLFRMSVASGILGVFGGIILSLPVILPCSEKTRRILLLIIALCIILAFCLVFFADIGGGVLHEAHALLCGDADDSFGSGRIYIWKNVLQRIPDDLLFGAGPDTMALAGIPPFKTADPVTGKVYTSFIDVAHNEYLNVLYHQGLFALLAYLAALMISAAKWIKQPSIFGCGVLAYCIYAFFGFSMCITAPFFWLCWALLEAYNGKNSQNIVRK